MSIVADEAVKEQTMDKMLKKKTPEKLLLRLIRLEIAKKGRGRIFRGKKRGPEE